MLILRINCYERGYQFLLKHEGAVMCSFRDGLLDFLERVSRIEVVSGDDTVRAADQLPSPHDALGGVRWALIVEWDIARHCASEADVDMGKGLEIRFARAPEWPDRLIGSLARFLARLRLEPDLDDPCRPGVVYAMAGIDAPS